MIQYTVPTLLLAVAVSTSTVDTPSIDDVAREYRIQTYDTYRTHREEYNRRIEIGKEAVRRYEAADIARQQEILDWFAQSTKGSLSEIPGGDFQTTDQIADDTAEAVTNSVAFEAPAPDATSVSQSQETADPSDSESATPSWDNSSVVADSNDTIHGEIDLEAEEWNDTETNTYETSVVRTDKFGIAPKSRTFSILGSVGRAMTFAVASGATGDHSSPQDLLEGPEQVEADEEPTPAEHHDEEVSEDLELEQLILESPASDNDVLEPTSDSFLNDATWRPNSSVRLSRRVEKLEKALHRVTVRLDMPGMTVQQIEGAVELAEEMCWNYRTVTTYLEATGGDTSIVDATQVRDQVQRLAERLSKGMNTYKEAVKEDPSISRYIVTLEDLILRTDLLKGEINA